MSEEFLHTPESEKEFSEHVRTKWREIDSFRSPLGNRYVLYEKPSHPEIKVILHDDDDHWVGTFVGDTFMLNPRDAKTLGKVLKKYGAVLSKWSL